MTDSDDVIVIMRKVTEQYGERFALAVATELAYEANATSAAAARKYCSRRVASH